jgi:sugar phosphate isomerase/epimerase
LAGTPQERALLVLLKALQGHDVAWALTGSAAFALQGVPVGPHDIDVQTDEAGAYAIQSLFPGRVQRPVTLSEATNVRSHFGAITVEGVEVEIMGALQKRLPSGGWEPPVDVRALRIFVPWEGYQVPVLPLEYECGAYARLGRYERAAELRRFLRERAESGQVPAVQCSTGPLASLVGGRWWDATATLKGVSLLAWPFVELRLWQEWNQDFVDVARRVRQAGADVLTVHAPPLEELLSVPGREDAAASMLRRCADAAVAADARAVVVHAWGPRLSGLDLGTLTANLTRACGELSGRGLVLSIENIPGHSEILPVVLEACPDLAVTVDTRWTVAEQSWDLMLSLAPRVNNIHVQTFLDVTDTGGGAGHVSLGRTSAGEFDLPGVLRAFLSRGFRGTVTLEANNVPPHGDIHLRNALVMLRKLTVPHRATCRNHHRLA